MKLNYSVATEIRGQYKVKFRFFCCLPTFICDETFTFVCRKQSKLVNEFEGGGILGGEGGVSLRKMFNCAMSLRKMTEQ